MIIYDVLQHFQDDWCSPEGWDSLLTSLLAENDWKQRKNMCTQLICQKIQHRLVIKNMKLTECLVVSSYVLTLKHKFKQRLITRKQLFVCSWSSWMSLFWVISHCLTLCFSVGTWEDTTKLLVSFTSFKSVYCVFTWLVHMLLRCCFQPAVTSALSFSSQDCTACHNNAVEHRIWSWISLL